MEPGIISTVDYRNGGVLCDVEAIRVNTTYRAVPVLRSFSGEFAMPQVNQKVVLGEMADGTRIITGFLTAGESQPTDMQPNEYTVRLDDSTAIEATQNGDGTYDLAVSASGTLDVDGDTVQIDGTSDVVIDGIDFDQHTHDYDDSTVNDTSDGTGSESSTTKTTNAPN